MTFARVFFLERNFTQACGAQAALWGALGVFLYFGALLHILRLGGHISRLGGTSCDLGGQGSKMPPPSWRPGLYPVGLLIL